MKRKLSLAVLLFITACGGTGGKVDVNGFVFPHVAGGTVPTSGDVSITVLGRDANEFPLSFPETAPTATGEFLSFTLQGLPAGELLSFQVGASNLDTMVSFPLLVDPDTPLVLGAVSTGLIAQFKAEAEVGVMAGRSIDLVNDGVVWGIVDPAGRGESYSSVALLNREDQSVAADPHNSGPFYFGPDGQLHVGVGFLDTEKSYLFWNVRPGLYTLRFAGTQTRDVDIVALGGKTTFGYDIP